MEEITDLNSFRNAFIYGLSLSLDNKGYQYKKTKEVFIKLNDDHQFSVFIYAYRRSDFIEIETKAYYSNNAIEKKLKEIGIKVLDDKIWGGSIKFISEYYFETAYLEKYANLIYEFGGDISPLIQTWLAYFSNIIEPFLKDCTNPVTLNKLVNKERMNTCGLSASYEKRVLRFYYVGKMAGLSEAGLRELSDLYEERLKSLNAGYLPKFMEMKSKLIL